MRTGCTLAVLLLLGGATSCTYTVAEDVGNPPFQLRPPSYQPTVEYTVAEFKFALGSGDMATAIFDGRLLSEEIMKSWQERGYVSAHEDVTGESFSGTADYHLTLRGSQRGETSFTMQVINVLTLSLAPYTITERYDFQYVLEDVRRGTQYIAAVQASEKTWVEPLLVFALPWADRGHRTTMQRVADSLFVQFALQGAFTDQEPEDVEATRDPP